MSQEKTAVNPKIHFETTQGNFKIEIFSDVKAHAENFINLVSANFYDGLIYLYRYEPFRRFRAAIPPEREREDRIKISHWKSRLINM